MTDAARDAARAAEQSPVMRGLARGGYAANGVVHALLGAIIIAIAFGGKGQSDQVGAFSTLPEAPLGIVALWALAVLLAGLGVWHLLLQPFLVRGRNLSAWGRRISDGSPGVVYITLSVVAVAVALGARPNSDQSAQAASRGLLATPGGVFVLGAVGLGLAIAGVCFVTIGVRRTFDKKVRKPAGTPGTVVTVTGVVGYTGKGVAIGIVGVLLLVAAIRQEARAAGGLDAAVQALLEQMFGPVLVCLVGAGLMTYGAFCFLRARYARL